MIMPKENDKTVLSFLKMSHYDENNMNPNLTASELEQMDAYARFHNKIAKVNNKLVESIENKFFNNKDNKEEETEMERD